LRQLFADEYERNFDPRGVARQLAALIANGDRRSLLRSITAPSVVLHGAADQLIPVACGEDVASTSRMPNCASLTAWATIFPLH
jgi:pimeloyl-ACP methyl ester carboxylesterase